MPWTVAILRGQRVLARTNPDGTLAVEGGRVEIRYRATDPKAYRASAGNLSFPDGAEKFADEAVVAGQEAPSRDAASAAKKPDPSSASSSSSAPKPSRIDRKDAAP